MFSNYIKIALRTLWKFKGYTSINLIGLSLGLTAGILILIYVSDELSYDKFHLKSDRTYRVVSNFFTPESGGAEGGYDTNGWPVGNMLRKDFPEVEAVLYARGASHLLINKDDKHIRENIQFVSPEFFSIFSFPVIKGNAEKALTDPYAAVLTASMEKKYFNGQDALGKTLLVSDTIPMVVTAVIKDLPSNSHIQADMFFSFATFERLQPSFNYSEGWGNMNVRNYVLLREGTDAAALAAKAKNLYTDHAGEMLKNWGVKADVLFEPLDRLYLYSHFGNGMGPAGSIDRIYLIAGIGVFVILLACINFINLSTARSVYRAREVGLRKVVGSTRAGLMRQFLSESMLLTMLAMFVAIVLSGLLLPLFNQLLDKHYQLSMLVTPQIVGGMVALIFVITALAGYYPAWVLSSLRPSEVLKGNMQTGNRGVALRRTLVVFQFAISAALVVGTLIVLHQLDFMQRQALGFAKDEVVVLNVARTNATNPTSYQSLKNEIKSLAQVEEVSFNAALPGARGWVGQVAYPEGKTGDRAISVEYMAVDEDYVKTLQLEVIAGRNFDVNRDNDLEKGLVLNQTAVAMFGWSSPEDAIGKRIESPSGSPEGEVIGVVKDYHQAGLQQKISPAVMDYNQGPGYLYAVRYKAADTKAMVAALELLWKKHFAGYDFNYFFLDDNFEKQYQSEQRLASVFALFAVVTIVIAAIGLLGLVSFMTAARTKEIGIRKILGAGVYSIVTLLSKEFITLVVIANLIAFPIAWYFSSQWLQGFAYRMSIDPMLFVWTLLVVIVATLATVSYQTIRAAVSDPVDSLRHE